MNNTNVSERTGAWAATGAHGVVTGSLHRRLGRPGQDASWIACGPAAAIAVVADGCGSAPSSEVGARIGVRAWSHAVQRQLAAGGHPADLALWTTARAEVVAGLATLAASLGGDRSEAIRDHLLFTTVIAVVTPSARAIYAIGDGAFGTDDETTVLQPGADNAPAYVAYDLEGAATPARLELWPGTPAGIMWVATDGVAALLAGHAPAVHALVADPRAARQPDRLRRQLEVWARGEERIDWEARRIERTAGALTDDGALAVLRWGAAP